MNSVVESLKVPTVMMSLQRIVPVLVYEARIDLSSDQSDMTIQCGRYVHTYIQPPRRLGICGP